MLGVLVAQDISRVLQHHVLEPSASAEARDTILPGESDRPQGLLKILVRTARGHPHTAEPVEERVIDFRCRNLFRLEVCAKKCSRVLNGGIRGHVGRKRGIVLAQQSDSRVRFDHISG